MTLPHRLLRPLLVLIATCTFANPGAAQTNDGVWQVGETTTIDTEGYGPKLSPDGRWIAGIRDLDQRQLCIWQVSTGEERCNMESDRVAEATIAWSPDSRFVAWSQNGHQLDSDIFVLNVLNDSLTNYTDDEVDDLKEASTASRFVIYDRWPVWSADGSEIVFVRILDPRSETGQRQISVSRIVLETGQVVRGQDLTTDEPLEFVAETLGVVTPPVITPDGVFVFALRGGADVAGVYRADLREPRPLLVESDPAIRASNVPLVTGSTTDGDRISFYWLWGDFGIGNEQYPYGWLDVSTGEILPLDVRAPRDMIVAAPPTFSADGTAIVYGVTDDLETSRNATIVVQDLQTGDVTEIATGVSLQFWEGVTGLTWTDGNQIVVPLDDGSFEVITLERT
jgi:Tol biopolymer transport system component